MTPETDHEKEALKWMDTNDDIEIARYKGTYDDEPQPYAFNSDMCKGGYLRRFAVKDSLIFVLTPRQITTN